MIGVTTRTREVEGENKHAHGWSGPGVATARGRGRVSGFGFRVSGLSSRRGADFRGLPVLFIAFMIRVRREW